MKKLLLGIAAVCLAGFTFAQDAPLWMRHSVSSLPMGPPLLLRIKETSIRCRLPVDVPCR